MNLTVDRLSRERPSQEQDKTRMTSFEFYQAKNQALMTNGLMDQASNWAVIL
jgi:hypothetical protein